MDFSSFSTNVCEKQIVRIRSQIGGKNAHRIVQKDTIVSTCHLRCRKRKKMKTKPIYVTDHFLKVKILKFDSCPKCNACTGKHYDFFVRKKNCFSESRECQEERFLLE